MNRWDLIQGTARDIASNVHVDPALRDAMADDLIKLVGLMINATGKIVASHGEGQVNDASDWVFAPDTESIDYSDAELADQQAEFEAEQSREATLGGTIYSTGERVQEAADEVVAESTNPGVDLDRWVRPSPGDPCRCGHVPKVHESGQPCNGEQFNGEACKGGPCNGFVRREPQWGWRHVDRRPHVLRAATPAATPAATADTARPCCYTETGRCATCRNGGPIGGCCRPLHNICPTHR